MGFLDVLSAHGDTIVIALIVAVCGAVPGTVAAIMAARNGRAVADMHDCLDRHCEEMTAAVKRADAFRDAA